MTKPNLQLAHGIAVDTNGKIYIVANTENVLKTFYPNGQRATPSFTRGLNSPSAIALGPDGKLYIANFLAVGTYTPEGQRIQPNFIHIGGDGGPATATAVAVDADGSIYAGYYSVGGGHGAAVVFSPDGKQLNPAIIVPDGVSGIAVH